MKVISDYRSEDIAAAALAEGTEGVSQGGAMGVSVEIADPARLENARTPWAALLVRADALNVFMDPTLVRVAAEIDPSASRLAGMEIGRWATPARRELDLRRRPCAKECVAVSNPDHSGIRPWLSGDA